MLLITKDRENRDALQSNIKSIDSGKYARPERESRAHDTESVSWLPHSLKMKVHPEMLLITKDRQNRDALQSNTKVRYIPVNTHDRNAKVEPTTPGSVSWLPLLFPGALKMKVHPEMLLITKDGKNRYAFVISFES